MLPVPAVASGARTRTHNHSRKHTHTYTYTHAAICHEMGLGKTVTGALTLVLLWEVARVRHRAAEAADPTGAHRVHNTTPYRRPALVSATRPCERARAADISSNLRRTCADRGSRLCYQQLEGSP